MDATAIEQYVENVRARHPEFQEFTGQMTDLLRRLIAREGLNVQDIHGRCKEVDEIRNKVLRKRYTDPESQLMDIIGVRAVLYFDSDVDLVAEIIRREFNVDEANSEDKRSPSNEQLFGYRSYHLVALLNDQRAKSTEYAPFRNTPIEFQVRSMLAHTWEAIDRQMDYKKEDGQGLSPSGKRLMARVSAMLETADDLFNQLRAAENQVQAAKEAMSEEGTEPRRLRWDE